MNIRIAKKTWTEQEKAYLSLGYKMGASLKTLSIVLNRTETSLNKALERLGIRQYGTKRGKKSKAERSYTVTPQNFQEKIKAYDSAQDQITLSSNPKVNKEKIFYPSPFIVFPKRHARPLPFWSDLDYIIGYLKKKGHRIQRCSASGKNLAGVKVEFYFNNMPISAAQLLMYANRLRLEQGLEAFYVESITEY